MQHPLILFISFLLLLFSCQKKELILKSDSGASWIIKDSNHQFLIHIDSLKYHENSTKKNGAVTHIEIFNDDQLIQTIHSPDTFLHEIFIDSNDIFVLEDMNFDGYNDIALLNWTSNDLQIDYWYWFYDRNRKTFQRDTILEGIWNPRFDAKNEIIYHHYKTGCCLMGQVIYKFENKQLIKLAEQEESINPTDPNEAYLMSYIYEDKDTTFIERKLEEDEYAILRRDSIYELIGLKYSRK